MYSEPKIRLVKDSGKVFSFNSWLKLNPKVRWVKDFGKVFSFNSWLNLLPNFNTFKFLGKFLISSIVWFLECGKINSSKVSGNKSIG